MYSSGIIYKECAQQVYASAPWSSIGHKKDPRFKVELAEKNIKRDI
jgi:hypothetical protein